MVLNTPATKSSPPVAAGMIYFSKCFRQPADVNLTRAVFHSLTTGQRFSIMKNCERRISAGSHLPKAGHRPFRRSIFFLTTAGYGDYQSEKTRG
jgi:hypothetical protein